MHTQAHSPTHVFFGFQLVCNAMKEKRKQKKAFKNRSDEDVIARVTKNKAQPTKLDGARMQRAVLAAEEQEGQGKPAN